MLKVTNATVWERRNVWGCEYVFVQDVFHEFHQEPMKPVQIGPECCDNCLTNCPEFRLKIEGCAIKDFKIGCNITQICTDPWGDELKITRPMLTLRETTATQIQTTLVAIAPVITEIGPYVVKKTGIQKLLVNPEGSLKWGRDGNAGECLHHSTRVCSIFKVLFWIGPPGCRSICLICPDRRETLLGYWEQD